MRGLSRMFLGLGYTEKDGMGHSVLLCFVRTGWDSHKVKAVTVERTAWDTILPCKDGMGGWGQTVGPQ